MSNTELIKALVAAQTELENPPKSAQGYGYSYTPLDAIIDAVKPVLQKHGLVVSQLLEGETGDSVGIRTMLMHESGGELESVYYLSLTDLKQANKTQKMGASITYGRRYALAAILGIASDSDTDASDPPKKKGKSSKANDNSDTDTDDLPPGFADPLPPNTHEKPISSKQVGLVMVLAARLWPENSEDNRIQLLKDMMKHAGMVDSLKGLSSKEASTLIASLQGSIDAK